MFVLKLIKFFHLLLFTFYILSDKIFIDRNVIYMKIYNQFERESGIVFGVECSILENPKNYDKMPTFNTRVLSLYYISIYFYVNLTFYNF